MTVTRRGCCGVAPGVRWGANDATQIIHYELKPIRLTLTVAARNGHRNAIGNRNWPRETIPDTHLGQSGVRIQTPLHGNWKIIAPERFCKAKRTQQQKTTSVTPRSSVIERLSDRCFGGQSVRRRQPVRARREPAARHMLGSNHEKWSINEKQTPVPSAPGVGGCLI